MVEIKFNEKMFAQNMEGIVGMRFKNVEDIEEEVFLKTGLRVKLDEFSSNQEEILEGYDERLISNCELNGEELCYLDIYFIRDNSKKYYVTEVGFDFNT